MYINPFVAGILLTLFVEFSALIVYSAVRMKKK